jgi:hypothetical protein
LNKSLKVHYASSKLVIVMSLGAVLLGTIAYYALPDDGLPIAAALLKSAWVVLGPIGALSIQIAMQLLPRVGTGRGFSSGVMLEGAGQAASSSAFLRAKTARLTVDCIVSH